MILLALFKKIHKKRGRSNHVAIYIFKAFDQSLRRSCYLEKGLIGIRFLICGSYFHRYVSAFSIIFVHLYHELVNIFQMHKLHYLCLIILQLCITVIHVLTMHYLNSCQVIYTRKLSLITLCWTEWFVYCYSNLHPNSLLVLTVSS